MNALDHIYFSGRPKPQPGKSQPRSPAASKLRFLPDTDVSAGTLQGQEHAHDPLVALSLLRAGLDSGRYRAVALERRVPALLRALRARSPEQARTLIETQPGKLSGALNALLIGVSGFFRDETVFEELRTAVLPRLVARASRAGKPFRGLRVLSAGCSEGQELYSVAMLLADLQLLDGSTLWGIDARADAIDAARAGVFSDSEMASVPAHFRQRFFTRGAAGFLIAPELRRRMRWQVGDIMQPGLLPREWDLILCRNVAIYLTVSAGQALLTSLVRRLVPGGALVTGKAERPDRNFGLQRLAACIYEKSDHMKGTVV